MRVGYSKLKRILFSTIPFLLLACTQDNSEEQEKAPPPAAFSISANHADTYTGVTDLIITIAHENIELVSVDLFINDSFAKTQSTPITHFIITPGELTNGAARIRAVGRDVDDVVYHSNEITILVNINSNTPLVCTPNESTTLDCTAQFENATAAEITRTCNAGGDSYSDSACRVTACNMRFTILNNQCVQQSNSGQWPLNDTPYVSLTGFTMEVISEDIVKAYPGLEYDYRLAVRGGAYPFQFRLTQAPAGMSIHNRKGIVKWQAPQTAGFHNVRIEIKDSENITLVHAFQIEVTGSGFYFISPTGADNNAGTIDKPVQTIQGLGAKSFPADSIIYFRGGDYALTASVTLSNGFPKYWMAYPNEKPRIDCRDRNNCFGGFKDHESGYLFKGFEFHNAAFKFFSVGGANIEKIRWRNNLFRDLKVTDSNLAYENPSFIFFWDQGGFTRSRDAVLAGDTQYKNIVIQENEFTDIANYPGQQHASSTTWYDVHFSLFEDNLIHNLTDGFAFHDKDDGFFNTVRGNVLRDFKGIQQFNNQVLNSVSNGIQVSCQYICSDTEISHNLILGDGFNGSRAIALGMQGGIQASHFYVHHNTLIDANIAIGFMIGYAESDNYVLRFNLIKNARRPLYIANGSYDMNDNRNFIRYIINPPDLKTTINDNYLWSGNTNFADIITWSWGNRSYNKDEFVQNSGHETRSVFSVQTLSTDGHYSLAADDAYFGLYGKDVLPGAFQTQ